MLLYTLWMTFQLKQAVFKFCFAWPMLAAENTDSFQVGILLAQVYQPVLAIGCECGSE